MEAMLDLGRAGPPAFNFDEAHRFCLDTLLADEGLDIFDDTDRPAKPLYCGVLHAPVLPAGHR